MPGLTMLKKCSTCVVLLGIVLATVVPGCGPALTPAPAEPEATEAAPATEPATEPEATEAAPATEPVEGDEPREGGTLVIAWGADAPRLDPQNNQFWVNRLTTHVCENLVAEDTRAVDESYAPPKPGLAESWSISEDGLVYTFHLREGVKFTDGTVFDSEAVELSFDRYMNVDSPVYNARVAAEMSSLTAPIESYRAVDPMTFEITLKDPLGVFILILKHRMWGIPSPTALRAGGGEITGDNLVGTGPFKFVEQVPGERVVLERNPDYWGQVPYLERVVFAVMPDQTAQLAALRRGEVDMVIEMPPDRVPDLEAGPNVEVHVARSAHIFFWFLDHSNPVIQDPRIRQAIWHAIDTDEMVTSLFGTRIAVPMNGFNPPGNPAYRADYDRPYPYDPARAEELLADAGYARGELLLRIAYPILTGSFPQAEEVSQFTQAYLEAAGFSVELESYESTVFLEKFDGSTEGVHLLAGGWTSIADKPYMLEQLHSCDAGAWNDGEYCNPEFDAVLDEARGLTLEEGVPVYQRAEDMLLEDVGTIPILHASSPRGVHSKVQNVLFGPTPWWELTEVWLEAD